MMDYVAHLSSSRCWIRNICDRKSCFWMMESHRTWRIKAPWQRVFSGNMSICMMNTLIATH